MSINTQPQKTVNINFDNLEALIDKSLEAKSQLERCKIIAEQLVPFINNADDLEAIKLNWNSIATSNIEQRNNLDLKIPGELEQTFESLKNELTGMSFNPHIASQLGEIAGILENKEKFQLLHKFCSALNLKIQSLLSCLLDFKMYDIVRKYGKIESSFALVSPYTGQLNNKYISKFSFAPSLAQKHKLESIFYKHAKIQDAWVAWQIFKALEWNWNTSASFFDGKDQDSLLYEYWLEVANIKNGNEDSDPLTGFFKDSKLSECLKLIQKDLSHYKNGAMGKDPEIIPPYSIELRIYEYDVNSILVVDVFWNALGVCDTRAIHYFREKSVDLKFIKQLLIETEGTPINVNDFGGYSVSKTFKRLKLNNILGKVFFEKPDNNKTNYISMRSKKIVTKDLLKGDVIKLAKHIVDLTRVEPIC